MYAFLQADASQMLSRRNAALCRLFKPRAGGCLINCTAPAILIKKTQRELRQGIVIISGCGMISGKGLLIIASRQRCLGILHDPATVRLCMCAVFRKPHDRA